MKTFLAILTASVISIASIQSSKAIPYVNLVNNGSFENAFTGWGSTGWGWTYNFGLDFGFPGAADGGNFAEAYGDLFQTIATVPGTQYDFRFALSGNFNISQPQTINILWGGTTIGSVSWSPAGHNVNNLGWVWGDFHVYATSSSTVITLSNPYVGDGSGRIAKIDAVSVAAIPDTSVYLTPTFALVVFGLFWAKKRNHRRAG
jgi:hypothetical protein